MAAERVVSRRSCWWLELIAGHATSKGKIENEEKSPWTQSRFETQWQRMCGMPGITERLLVSPPPVRGVRAHRLLRQFPESACVKACGGDRTSDHSQLRVWCGLVLRLREAGDDQGGRVASATFASGKSARSWSSRKGAS